MDYGAEDLSVVKQAGNLPFELSRHLYKDMYVIQEMDLTTKKPVPEFEIWPEHTKEPVLEFQNTENTTVRLSRIKLVESALPQPASPAPPATPQAPLSTPAVPPAPPPGL
jgi:hypothetical protein